jgi:hypothetical protein
LARLVASLGVYHLVERGLHVGLQPLRELVENVAEFVEPAPLLAGLRPHVAYCFPETEGTVPDGDDRRARASTLQVAEHGLPALSSSLVTPKCTVVAVSLT